AQNDIIGIDNTVGLGTRTADALWTPWMEVGATPNVTFSPLNVNSSTQTHTTQTSIDFGAFDQGVMSVGGNVSVSAGGNVTNFEVSLPTTWYLSQGVPVTVGGGNLSV